MSKITVTTIAGATSGSDANKVKIESGDTLEVVSNATVGGDLTVDTSTLKVDSSNNRVGMGTASPSRQVMISRSIADGSGELGIVSSDSSTSGALGNIHFGNSTDTSLASIRATADGATDAGKLEFNTEKTGAAIETAMGIDSNGRVTKPLQPSFSASYTGTNAMVDPISSDVNVPFNTTSVHPNNHNIGNHYNTSNFRFTAPVAGRYIFLVHMGHLYMAANEHAVGEIRKNGTRFAYNYIQPTTNAYDCLNLTFIINLAVNDYVNVTMGGNAQYYKGPSEIAFAGHLLG